MVFNSSVFLLFFIVFFFIYWRLNNNHSVVVRNIFILVSSYFFYGWWDWRFLSLIFISSLSDYFLGQKIYKVNLKRKRKLLLAGSILINIGILGFFKYFNFFAESLQYLFSSFGINLSYNTLNIILPVGISFYTFQTMSYTIDIYKGKLKPTNDIVTFFAFVSFFPQLVAGPIE
jgi:D-alanyl-lipoteichoic acid acyltransferase DltB (MBOAT superfamily)